MLSPDLKHWRYQSCAEPSIQSHSRHSLSFPTCLAHLSCSSLSHQVESERKVNMFFFPIQCCWSWKFPFNQITKKWHTRVLLIYQGHLILVIHLISLWAHHLIPFHLSLFLLISCEFSSHPCLIRCNHFISTGTTGEFCTIYYHGILHNIIPALETHKNICRENLWELYE